MVYIFDEIFFNALPRMCSRLRSVLDKKDHECIAKVDDALVEDLGPNGWVYENEEFRGLEVGTKVVCTNSFIIGHVGSVEAIHNNGDVTYRFASLQDSLKTYELWESKSKWRFKVVPPETDMLKIMTEAQVKQYYEIHQTDAEKRASSNMKMYEAFLPPGEWKRREEIEIRCTKEDNRRKIEDARRLIENKIGGDTETLLRWRIIRENENLQRVLENGRRKTEQKQIEDANERAIHRYSRKGILAYFLNDVSCLADLIFDIEEMIQLWSNPLGWVFEDGKYKGLRRGSRVVCTARCIGHVGYVSSIENDISGAAKYYFPTYRKGKFEEVYNAAQAIKSWRLCIVPDDTDLTKRMSGEEALAHLRNREE